MMRAPSCSPPIAGNDRSAAAGVAAKCLTPIAGSPMVVRVVRALEQSGCVHASCFAVLPRKRCRDPGAQRVGGGRQRPLDGSAGNARHSAAAALATLPDEIPVLLTTGDHALLNAEMVRHFLMAASAAGGDVAVALAPHDLVRSTYPRTRRTVLKFSDGHFCGCNLFAFLTPRARRMARLWQQVENDRKKPIRVIGFVGWVAMARYALGMLSLPAAVRRLSERTGIDAAVVTMPFAEAAIDVDSVADLELVRAIVAQAP
jgi:CTP:molybdopterin cytidylyltransferase MocA